MRATFPSIILADTLSVLVSLLRSSLVSQSCSLPLSAISTHCERSSTIQSAPRPSSSARGCEVHTASTYAPAALPDLMPEGASSTTTPER